MAIRKLKLSWKLSGVTSSDAYLEMTCCEMERRIESHLCASQPGPASSTDKADRQQLTTDNRSVCPHLLFGMLLPNAMCLGATDAWVIAKDMF